MKELTRQEAIERVGSLIVSRLDKVDCEATGRCMQAHEKAFMEFRASTTADVNHAFECPVVVEAYYYQRNEDVENSEDIGDLTWEVDHYEVTGMDL